MLKHPVWIVYMVTSLLLPIWIVYQAHLDHNTIFSMMIALCQNKLNILIFLNFMGVMVVQLCYLVISLFFGDIRIIEI